ncbi:MAG: hypothetical protein ACOC22_03830 [bacterium]
MAEFSMFTFILTKFFSLMLGLFGIFLGLGFVSLIIKKWSFIDIFKHDKVTNGGIFVAAIIIAIGIMTGFSVL